MSLQQRIGEMRRMAQGGVDAASGWGKDYHRGYLRALEEVEETATAEEHRAVDTQADAMHGALDELEKAVNANVMRGHILTLDVRNWINHTRKLIPTPTETR
jgi:hypothetical protein